jgi:hypothetical protein
MAMNNTASVVPCQLWVGADKPLCYSQKILQDPRLMKFAGIGRRNIRAGNIDWKFQPNTYFFGTTEEGWNYRNFLNPDRDFVWWKNTFYIAIQILYRLGFRKIYLIGCQFKIGDKHYSYDKQLTGDEKEWNKKTYNHVVTRMKELKPLFDRKDFKVISCTPDSPLNEIYPTMDFDEAIADSLQDFPRSWDINRCVHSSFFKDKE